MQWNNINPFWVVSKKPTRKAFIEIKYKKKITLTGHGKNTCKACIEIKRKSNINCFGFVELQLKCHSLIDIKQKKINSGYGLSLGNNMQIFKIN